METNMMIIQQPRIRSCFGLFVRTVFQFACFSLVFVAIAHPQDAEMRKRWNFTTLVGNLSISLEVFKGANGGYVDRFLLETDSKQMSTDKEADALKTVFRDLESSHYPVRSGVSILFRLNQRDAIAKLAAVAAGSATWKSKSKTGNSNQINPLVVDLLNKSAAYDAFNQVLASFHLTGSVVSAEKVLLESFNASGAVCPPSSKCQRLRVPTDAIVQIDLAPAATP